MCALQQIPRHRLDRELLPFVYSLANGLCMWAGGGALLREASTCPAVCGGAAAAFLPLKVVRAGETCRTRGSGVSDMFCRHPWECTRLVAQLAMNMVRSMHLEVRIHLQPRLTRLFISLRFCLVMQLMGTPFGEGLFQVPLRQWVVPLLELERKYCRIWWDCSSGFILIPETVIWQMASVSAVWGAQKRLDGALMPSHHHPM